MNKKVYAYYFPNWHIDEKNEEWHGKGWTEWDVLKCALPKFENHYQPKKPLWGYEDESDPSVMAKKIGAAVTHGVDGFIFDWYWVEGKPYRNKCIEEGFLKAENCNKADFAIMLCNHQPIQAHPTPRIPRSVPLAECTITPEIFKDIAAYCIEHYFAKDNYIKVDGALLFSIFNIAKFVKDMGGLEVARQELLNFKKTVKDAGLGEIHFNSIDAQGCILRKMLEEGEVSLDAIGNQGKSTDILENDFETINFAAEYLGINSWCTHLLPFPEMNGRFPDIPFSEWVKNYEEFCKARNDKYNVPYNPCVTMGWDPSPRTVQSEKYENIGYPYTRIINGNTPEALKEFLVRAKKVVTDGNSTAKFITIHSWNEWTEGAYLEPDDKYGYQYLEAVKEVFR